MKSSLLALATAFALTLGATSATFSQDATTMPTPEECAALQSAAPTTDSDGAGSTTTTDGDDEATDNPPAEGADPDADTDLAALCAELEESED